MEKELLMSYVESSVGYIKKDIEDIKHDFVRLGFHLYENRFQHYYEYVPVLRQDYPFEGYVNVYDFCYDYFGLSKSTCSRLIDICLKFCDGRMFLNDKYKDYGYSQLVKMLPMSDDELRKVRPDMSVREIESIRKMKLGIVTDSCNVATTDIDVEYEVVPDNGSSLSVVDMLVDVVNRMCVVNDISELEEMLRISKTYIDELYSLALERLEARG